MVCCSFSALKTSCVADAGNPSLREACGLMFSVRISMVTATTLIVCCTISLSILPAKTELKVECDPKAKWNDFTARTPRVLTRANPQNPQDLSDQHYHGLPRLHRHQKKIGINRMNSIRRKILRPYHRHRTHRLLCLRLRHQDAVVLA